MDRAIVKLNALSDTDWTGTKNNDLFLFFVFVFLNKLLRFIFIIIGRIEVRSLCRKFRSTGINHFVGSETRMLDLLAGKLFNGLIKETKFLCGEVLLIGQLAFRKLLLHMNEI